MGWCRRVCGARAERWKFLRVRHEALLFCERLGIVTVATVNLRDFAAVRPRHVPAFITVPGLG